MAELIDVLQGIMQENSAALKPADVVMGTVTSVSPLSVQVQATMQNIPAAALILTSAVVAKTAQVQGGEGGTVIINEDLVVGDKVVMLGVSRGQRYIILSKTQGV